VVLIGGRSAPASPGRSSRRCRTMAASPAAARRGCGGGRETVVRDEKTIAEGHRQPCAPMNSWGWNPIKVSRMRSPLPSCAAASITVWYFKVSRLPSLSVGVPSHSPTRQTRRAHGPPPPRHPRPAPRVRSSRCPPASQVRCAAGSCRRCRRSPSASPGSVPAELRGPCATTPLKPCQAEPVREQRRLSLPITSGNAMGFIPRWRSIGARRLLDFFPSNPEVGAMFLCMQF
jgi:hypothetical protein